jgi:hypothetical protein
MEERQELRQIATVGIILFLLVWTFVENLMGIKPRSSAPPGTTFRAATQAGATVTPSTSSSALDSPLIPPGPVEAKQEDKDDTK